MSDTMAQQLRRQMDYAFAGSDWHPPVSQLVDSVTAEQAVWRPPQGGHSIWELVHHLAYSKRLMAARLRGERASWQEAEGWVVSPAVPDAAGWAAEVAALKAAHAELAGAVAAMGDAALAGARGAAGRPLLDGLFQLVHHDAYHGGQIAYLRRLLGLETLM